MDIISDSEGNFDRAQIRMIEAAIARNKPLRIVDPNGEILQWRLAPMVVSAANDRFSREMEPPIAVCGDCGQKKLLPLFYMMEGPNVTPFCQEHVVKLIGKKEAQKLGPWEYKLSNSVSILRVRR